MRCDLTGKLALITGASRGIGKAIATALHADGASIIAVARSQSALDELVAGCGGQRCTPWAGDATGDWLIERIGHRDRIDILVNNVGTNQPQMMTEVSDDTLDLMLDLNVRATYRISRSVIGVMPDGGRIINITSQMGHVGGERRTVYCMTKHAIEGLTKAMAIELAPRGIRVNAIAPTFVQTDLTGPMLADQEFADLVRSAIPLGQIAQPEDVASAACYLAGPGGSMITGHSVRVDGGWTAQ